MSKEPLGPAEDTKARLLDAGMIEAEFGLKRETAYKVMQAAGFVDLRQAGVRKLMVWRDDLERYLNDITVRP